LNKNHFLNTLYLENRIGLALFINSLIYSKNCNDVEDCLQEVFLIVIRKSKTDNIEAHPNIKGWLFSIARNVASRFNAAYMKVKTNSADSAELSEEDFSEQLLEDIVYSETNREKLLDDMGTAHIFERFPCYKTRKPINYFYLIKDLKKFADNTCRVICYL